MTDKKSRIRIEIPGRPDIDSDTLIFVPWDSPEFPQKLMGLTTQSPSMAKHAYHALSEIALVDFEDKVIEPIIIPEGQPITVHDKKCESPMEQGLVIARDLDGKIHILAHDHVDLYRLLKFANRHCTRWIRLDI